MVVQRVRLVFAAYGLELELLLLVLLDQQHSPQRAGVMAVMRLKAQVHALLLLLLLMLLLTAHPFARALHLLPPPAWLGVCASFCGSVLWVQLA